MDSVFVYVIYSVFKNLSAQPLFFLPQTFVYPLKACSRSGVVIIRSYLLFGNEQSLATQNSR